jgi:hypothetical protein
LATGKAVRVSLLQAEQQQLNGGQLQAKQLKVNVVLQVEAAKVYLNSSIVLVIVMIIIKYRLVY